MKAILLNRVLLVLGFIGLFIAGVLSLEAGLGIVVPCGADGGCAKVAADPSSHFLFGIPNAYLGVLGYLGLIGLAILRSLRPIAEWRRFVTLGYILASLGTLFSIGLQYYSLEYIHATCKWCLGSAVTMVITLIVYAMLAQEMEEYKPRPTRPSSEADPETGPAPAAPFRTSRTDIGLMAGLPIATIVAVAAVGMGMSNAATPGHNDDFSKVEFIPKDAHILGNPNSPLTIVEFADLCCPACQRVSPQVKEFVTHHTGQVRLVFRNYPLPMHQLSMPAATIAECMADDNRFWDFTLGVMALQREPNDMDELYSIAKSLGANVDKIKKRLDDTDDPSYVRLARDLKAVKDLGISSTPTFFMMADGKVQDVLGPSQIMDMLNGDKYKTIMNRPHA